MPDDAELVDSIPFERVSFSGGWVAPTVVNNRSVLAGNLVVNLGTSQGDSMFLVPVNVRDLKGKLNTVRFKPLTVLWNGITTSDEKSSPGILLHLRDSSLLFMAERLTDVPGQAQPSWWNWQGIQGKRGALEFFRSDDNGRSWTRSGILDLLHIENGNFAPPVNARRNGRINGDFAVPARFSNPVLHYHPGSGKLYLSAMLESGLLSPITESMGQPNEHKQASLVWVSDDLGQNWKQIFNLPGELGPIQVTTSKEGRVLMVYNDGKNIVSRLSTTPNGDSFTDPQILRKPGQYGQDTLAHILRNPRLPQVAIAPFGNTDFQIAVPVINPWGRQEYHLFRATVQMKETPSLKLKAITAVKSEKQATYSCMGGTFADGQPTGNSMFFWLESSGDRLVTHSTPVLNHIYSFSARYVLINQEGKVSDAGFLSQVGGKPRYWFPVDREKFLAGQTLNATALPGSKTPLFAAAWREDGAKVKYNLVKVANPMPGDFHGGKRTHCFFRGQPYVGITLGLAGGKPYWETGDLPYYTTTGTFYHTPSPGIEFGFAGYHGFVVEGGFRFSQSKTDLSLSDSAHTYSITGINVRNYYVIPLRLKYNFNKASALQFLAVAGARFNLAPGAEYFHEDPFDRSDNTSIGLDIYRRNTGSFNLSWEAGGEVAWRFLRKFSLNATALYHLNSGIDIRTDYHTDMDGELTGGTEVFKFSRFTLQAGFRMWFLQPPTHYKPTAVRDR